MRITALVAKDEVRPSTGDSAGTLVKRFTVSERAVHWITAFAFFTLLISGLLVGRSGPFTTSCTPCTSPRRAFSSVVWR